MWKVPLCVPEFGDDELEAVQRPLRDGWLTCGPRTAELEEDFRALTGARHAIAVTNGTAALHLSLRAAGVGPGDEVVVPSLTFVASANAVRYTGATVVFGEILGDEEPTLDPADVRRRVGPRTRAIVVVHYAGHPCRMEELGRVAREHDLTLIEDCAHALVTRTQGGTLGTLGFCGCFSFFTNKNAACGEGGMIATANDEVAARLRRMRTHGMTSSTSERHGQAAGSYDCAELGWNARLDEIRASLARVQLRRLPEFLERRRRVREWYLQELETVDVVVPFAQRPTPDGDRVGWHVMPVVLPRGVRREAVREHMAARGIETSVHYPPAHRLTAARAEAHPPLPVTESFAARELTLPFYPSMTRDQVRAVVAALAAGMRTEAAARE